MKLGWEYGVTCNISESADTYDPGDGCNNSVSKTIKIPKTISDITNGAIVLNECGGECLTVNADICVQGDHTVKAKAFYSSSDRNLKENISSISSDSIENAKKVNLKQFNFKDDESKRIVYGVIAQDVEAVGLNNLVHKDENGNLSVDYTSLLLLKIANLEKDVEMLNTKINLLSDRINFGK